MPDAEPSARVLFTEDNPADAELALHGFRRHKLIDDVMWLDDGTKALEYMLHQGRFAHVVGHPKVVLLDLGLPGTRGLDVLQELRANAATREVPVVVLSSSTEPADVSEAYQFGANSYIRKPVAFKEFAETVSQIALYWTTLNRVTDEDELDDVRRH